MAFVTADRPISLLDSTASDTPSVPTGVMRIGAAPLPGVASVEKKAAVAISTPGPCPEPTSTSSVASIAPRASSAISSVGGGKTKDGNGHGTHVAGTVAAKDTGQGVVGVSPGTPLYAVRVFTAFGAGSLSNVVCGLDWVAANAAANNIKVVNMSLGGEGTDDGNCGATDKDAFHAAVCKVNAAGVTVVVAAGNSKEDLAKSVPANYDEVLAVTAMADFDGKPGGLFSSTAAADCSAKSTDDVAATFSNFAVPGSPDAAHVIAAPGVCITSTWNDGKFKSISGTSMASPHVAGLVARCIDAGPCAGMTPAQIIAKLKTDAAARPADQGFLGDPHRPADGKFYGHLVDDKGY